jgi:hypothetical protein
MTRTLEAMANAGIDPSRLAEIPDLMKDGSVQSGGRKQYKIRWREPSPPPSPPPPPVGRGKNAKKISNNRKLKDDPTNQAEQFYKKPDPIDPWGPQLTEKSKPIFEYFKGSPELWPSRTYTRDQLLLFFIGTWRFPRRVGKLTIWIQNTPAQSNERYTAGANSGKCRWVGCPARTKTILKGFLRVAFDENSKLTTKGIVDPFQNAGYMHLYCFEEIFDLGFLVHWSDIVWGFQVRPDVRVLPRENSNRMSLTRDHPELLEVYNSWKAEQAMRVFPKAVNMADTQPEGNSLEALNTVRRRSKKDYLWRRLTDAHLALEVSGRAATRDRRGGANIGEHRGDLRKFLALKGEMKRLQDEEDVDGDGDGDSVVEVPPPKKRKTVKRPGPRNGASSAIPVGANMHPVLNPPWPVLSPDLMMQLFRGTDLSHFQAMPNFDPQGGLMAPNFNPQGGLIPANFNGQANIPQYSFPRVNFPQAQANTNPPASFQTFHPPPLTLPPQGSSGQSLEQLHAIHTQQQSRPLTRAISRASAEAAQNTLASPELLSGPVMDELFDVLAPQPPHIRDQIISEAPAHVAEELQTRLASQPGEPTPAPAHAPGSANDSVIHNDHLDSRVGRLRKRERQDVGDHTTKRIENKDPRTAQTE